MLRAGGWLAGLFVAVGVIVPATPVAAGPDDAVGFAQNAVDVDERSGIVLLTVTRVRGIETRAGFVDYATNDITASAGRDYGTSSGTLVFEVGEAVKTISVPIYDDRISEGPEQLAVILSNPRGSLGSVGSPATVTVVDDEPPPSTPPPGRRGVVRKSTAAADTQAALETPTGSGRDARSSTSRPKRRPPRAAQPSVTALDLETAPRPAGKLPQRPASDSLLVVVAAVVLGRVGGEIWFRHRAGLV